MSLFAELRRRRVLRVAALYGVASWIITEVSATVLPALFVPEYVITVVVVLLILGFPVAMILAWIFDIGPSGVTRTETSSFTPSTGAGRGVLIGALIVGTAILSVSLYHFYVRGIFGGGAEEDLTSIAVLPFANLSQDPKNDYFSDGMAEEILNLLANVPDLRVAARTSSFAYKGEQVDIRDVANKLGVATVLEGSVRWASDNQVRITAQLINARTGFHLWSATYNQTLENVFEVQDAIAKQILDALKMQLVTPAGDETTVANVNKPPSGDFEAYDAYLKGRHFWKKRGELGIRNSIDLFQKALGRDPGYARAMSGLAAAYVLLPVYTETDTEEAFAMAKGYAQQALSINASLGEAHAVLAEINASRWNWTDAESDFFFALSLEPDEPTSHHWYSLLLRETGRLEESMNEAQRAYQLDPESPIIAFNVATAYMADGDWDRAEKFFQKARKMGLASAQGGFEARIHLGRGEYEEAARDFVQSAQDSDTEIPAEALQQFTDALVNPDLVPAFVEEFEQVPDEIIPIIGKFMVFLMFGDADRAMRAAERAIETQQFQFLWFWDTTGDILRAHPDFPALMQKAGLMDYWKRYGWPDMCQAGSDGDSVVCDN